MDCSVNTFVDKDSYLGEHVKLSLPGVDALVQLVISKGVGCHIFKKDFETGL